MAAHTPRKVFVPQIDFMAMGLELRSKRRWLAAASAFARAAQDDPKSAAAQYWMAVSYDNAGKELGAVPAYRRALELGLPRELEVRAYTWLASSLSKTGAHDEALTALDAAERLGGYEPAEAFGTLRDQVRRRSTPR